MYVIGKYNIHVYIYTVYHIFTSEIPAFISEIKVTKNYFSKFNHSELVTMYTQQNVFILCIAHLTKYCHLLDSRYQRNVLASDKEDGIPFFRNEKVTIVTSSYCPERRLWCVTSHMTFVSQQNDDATIVPGKGDNSTLRKDEIDIGTDVIMIWCQRFNNAFFSVYRFTKINRKFNGFLLNTIFYSYGRIHVLLILIFFIRLSVKPIFFNRALIAPVKNIYILPYSRSICDILWETIEYSLHMQ